MRGDSRGRGLCPCPGTTDNQWSVISEYENQRRSIPVRAGICRADIRQVVSKVPTSPHESSVSFGAAAFRRLLLAADQLCRVSITDSGAAVDLCGGRRAVPDEVIRRAAGSARLHFE